MQALDNIMKLSPRPAPTVIKHEAKPTDDIRTPEGAERGLKKLQETLKTMNLETPKTETIKPIEANLLDKKEFKEELRKNSLKTQEVKSFEKWCDRMGIREPYYDILFDWLINQRATGKPTDSLADLMIYATEKYMN